MRHEPTDERLLEAMEVCRPGSDDLADAAMADLVAELGRNRKLGVVFVRLQKVDAVLAGAIQDVPVPPGLCDRLLAAMAVGAAVEAADVPVAEAGQGDAIPAPAMKAPSHRTRRWVLSLSGAIAALVLVTVGWFQQTRVEYSPASVLEAAVEFFNSDAHDQGNLLSATSAPWGFPPSRYVRLTPDTRWHKAGTLLKSGGVAFEMTGPGGLRATLYVVRQSIAGLPDQPPPRPVYGTARCCSAAWQEGPLMYVLVVLGESTDYQRLVNAPNGPLA